MGRYQTHTLLRFESLDCLDGLDTCVPNVHTICIYGFRHFFLPPASRENSPALYGFTTTVYREAEKTLCHVVLFPACVGGGEMTRTPGNFIWLKLGAHNAMYDT